MAYIDQSTGRPQRLVVIGVVALIQGLATVALVNGLSVQFFKPAPNPNPRASDVPITVPLPPPSPLPKRETPLPKPVPMRGPISTLPTEPRQFDFPKFPPLPPLPEPTGVYHVDPLPSPPPSFAPRAAKPRGNVGAWATTSDYPARDLREGKEGLVKFSLVIGTDGAVQSCAIVESSGSPSLDAATCEKIGRRARFDAATDTKGAPTTGIYRGSIRWVIPKD